MTGSLDALEAALRASWALDTCDPVDVHLWRPDNPTRGQCGVTAMVVNDHLGGQLLEAVVTYADGAAQGFHTWNRLPDGTEVDWTLEQFTDGEVIGEPVVFDRPEGPPNRGIEQYDLLRSRVAAALGA